MYTLLLLLFFQSVIRNIHASLIIFTIISLFHLPIHKIHVLLGMWKMPVYNMEKIVVFFNAALFYFLHTFFQNSDLNMKYIHVRSISSSARTFFTHTHRNKTKQNCLSVTEHSHSFYFLSIIIMISYYCQIT